MTIAYKFLRLPDGVLFVFEKGMVFEGEETPITFVVKGKKNYLKILESHYIPLDEKIMGHLVETKRLYIGSSEITEPEIRIDGIIDLNDISMGKIIAYYEMEPN